MEENCRTHQKERVVVLFCLRLRKALSLEHSWEPIEASGLAMTAPMTAHTSRHFAEYSQAGSIWTYDSLPDGVLGLFQILKDTSLQKVKRNQSCLEPCLRQLVSCLESFVVGTMNLLSKPVLQCLVALLTRDPGSLCGTVPLFCNQLRDMLWVLLCLSLISESRGQCFQQPICTPKLCHTTLTDICTGDHCLWLIPGCQYSLSQDLWGQVLWSRLVSLLFFDS